MKNVQEQASRPNPIKEKSFHFAVAIVKFCDKLTLERKYVISNQLLKSGTSIGANVREAQEAESKSDFIHKMKIAAKECEETSYWLEICSTAYGQAEADILLNFSHELKKILSKIIISSKAS